MADTESTEVSDVGGLTDQITIVIDFSYEAPVDQNVHLKATLGSRF